MIRRRDKPDGLPFRVYERYGVKLYSIRHKGADGKRTFNLHCDVNDRAKIAELRREAIDRWNKAEAGAPVDGSTASLIAAWLKWQRALPDGTIGKRAESTLAENEREAKNLSRAWGKIAADRMTKAHAYRYLDACLLAKDKDGKPRPRPEKGNKEVALARVIFEWGIRVGTVKANPFDGVEKLRTAKHDRLVSAQELALAVEVGRRMAAPQHIVALALKTAWLCLRRSVEVRALTRDQIDDAAGIRWTGAKRQAGAAVKVGLIEWSPELRATIDEALAIKRNELAGAWYVFGNLSGQRYTKGGWKKTLSVLMVECVAEAARRRTAFAPFSLQDCRPMGVSTKLERGDSDTVDATLHTSDRMIRQVYDRRRVRKAKPAA